MHYASLRSLMALVAGMAMLGPAIPHLSGQEAGLQTMDQGSKPSKPATPAKKSDLVLKSEETEARNAVWDQIIDDWIGLAFPEDAQAGKEFVDSVARDVEKQLPHRDVERLRKALRRYIPMVELRGRFTELRASPKDALKVLVAYRICKERLKKENAFVTRQVYESFRSNPEIHIGLGDCELGAYGIPKHVFAKGFTPARKILNDPKAD